MDVTLYHHANSIYQILRAGWRTRGPSTSSGFGAVGGAGVSPHPLNQPVVERFAKGVVAGNPDLGIKAAAILIEQEVHDGAKKNVEPWAWQQYLEELNAKPGVRVLWYIRLRHGVPTVEANPSALVAATVSLKVAEKVIEAGHLIPLSEEQLEVIRREMKDRKTILQEVEEAVLSN